ncbi:hypothetical protein UC8_38250 [Roseimaritima ulvae]|uniref:Uncharacterized protein n=1 Tax=Roseimaritima ulvae TaxID=980254 RepID=A0A5B9QUZ9_9BACT|nr:hypothetical protein UC8_38250 [Roseimaritima ulvae]
MGSVSQQRKRRWSHARQDLPGFEQKPLMGPTTPGERAADGEAEPENGAEVGEELGQGQITSLIWGELKAYP